VRLHTAADWEEEEEVIAVVEDVEEGSGSAIDVDEEVMSFVGRQAE